MPLEVKDVEWSESDQNMVLKVPLKGANTKNLDIFSSNHYIKVRYLNKLKKFILSPSEEWVLPLG